MGTGESQLGSPGKWDTRVGDSGHRSRVPRTQAGSKGGQALHQRMSLPLLPGLGKDQGPAKKGRERGAAWEEGGVLGREGSPAPTCPLSRARTLPGSPGVAAAPRPGPE